MFLHQEHEVNGSSPFPPTFSPFNLIIMVYAFIILETEEILTSKSLYKYNQEYNLSIPNYLPNKTVYTSLGNAKRGFSHLHRGVKDHIGIASFSFNQIELHGSDLLAKQKHRREQEEREREERRIAYRKIQLQKELDELNNL